MFWSLFFKKMFFFAEKSCRDEDKSLTLPQIVYGMKKIFIISLTMAMAFAPISLLAETERDGIEMSVSGISLSINGGNVHIVGANGEVMEIFNLTGAKVATHRIDSNEKTFALNLPKGCYLIKVGKIVRKISVQ